jgi:hypothetical protein
MRRLRIAHCCDGLVECPIRAPDKAAAIDEASSEMALKGQQKPAQPV